VPDTPVPSPGLAQVEERAELAVKALLTLFGTD
jgi:hypothetical protein